MKVHVLMIGGLCAAVGISSVIAGYRIHEPSQLSFGSQSDSPKDRKTRSEKDLPLVDFDSPNEKNSQLLAVRKAKSKKYDKFSGHPIQDSPHISGKIWPSHWVQGLEAIPVKASDAVIVGYVADRQAYLSNDKTAVYSEFQVQISEVLKDNDGSLQVGITVPTERLGGAVRFPSGSIQRFETQGQDMPQLGKRYLLFLKRKSKDLEIITGYRLEDNKVFPLDGSNADEGSAKYPFDEYQGVEVSEFLNTVRSTASKN